MWEVHSISQTILTTTACVFLLNNIVVVPDAEIN